MVRSSGSGKWKGGECKMTVSELITRLRQFPDWSEAEVVILLNTETSEFTPFFSTYTDNADGVDRFFIEPDV